MLEEVRPDAVSICTPPSAHAEITLEALARGVHVLCEKPFAITLPDAKKMLNAAADAGLVLMMASKFRFVDDVVKAKGVIDSGILGQIVLFENVFCSRVDMRGRWNSRKDFAGGGVLFDNGSHSVDLARYLLGPITAVQAQHGLQVQPIEVEDTSRMYFKTAGGVMGSIDLRWSIHKEIESYVSVFGTEGTLSIGWRVEIRQSERWVGGLRHRLRQTAGVHPTAGALPRLRGRARDSAHHRHRRARVGSSHRGRVPVKRLRILEPEGEAS
jgi:predicted dehydrogenase